MLDKGYTTGRKWVDNGETEARVNHFQIINGSESNLILYHILSINLTCRKD